MKLSTRNVIVTILVIFALYAIIVSPVTAASWVQTVFVDIADGVRSIFTFFDALLRR